MADLSGKGNRVRVVRWSSPAARSGTWAAWTVVLPLSACRRRRLRHATLDLALLATVGIPSIVIGAGFLFAYNLPLIYRIVPIYGTVALRAAGYLAGQTPAAARLLAGRAAQLQPSLMQAARVHGHGPVASWRRTILPLMAPSLLRPGCWCSPSSCSSCPCRRSSIPRASAAGVAIIHQLRYDYAGAWEARSPERPRALA